MRHLVRSVAASAFALTMPLFAQTEAPGQRNRADYLTVLRFEFAAMNRATTCISAIRKNPQFSSLLSQLPSPNSPLPTKIQLADSSKPSRSEVKLFVAYENEASACRENTIREFHDMLPTVASVLRDLANQSDQNALGLERGEKSWAEYHRRRMEINQEGQPKIRRALTNDVSFRM